MSFFLPSVLTIAGSDPSGGAGIQADIKTIAAHGLYSTSVITSLTAQNTTAVYQTETVKPDMLKAQLDAVFTDIPPQAIKIGMLGSSDNIEIVATKLQNHPTIPVVVDPIMVSTSGRRLLDANAILTLSDRLFPLSSLITPNIPEAEALLSTNSNQKIHTQKDMEEAARRLSEQFHTAVLLKGGHCAKGADDVLYQQGTFTWFSKARLDNPNNHGTGCTLSSAIACGLANEQTLHDSIFAAKNYLTGALEAGLNLGKGNGPLWHGWNRKGSSAEK